MKKILITSLLTLLLYSVSAQTVGVVFSGGGARGLYHVGIIKALEENNIPIDYISGTSMGAIVGAMYSAGYSPDEMIKFFVTDSVQTWLAGKIPDEYRYYFKRYEPTPEMVAVNINPGKTKLSAVQLPTNVISPYRIDLAFMNMLQPASWAAGENFDSLMVPYRCVASDVYNKKAVTFKDGSMPFAVRASMSIPFAFTPMKYDSLLLYDGGLYNNFPYQVLQEDFAPDVLIGGICSINEPNPSQDDLMGQVMVMVTVPTNYEIPDSLGITVRARPNIGLFDYHRAPYVIALGYEDAMKMMPKIKERIKRRVSDKEIADKRKKFKAKMKPLIFEKIEIEGLTSKQEDYVMRQLGIDHFQHFNSEYFEEKYMRILATEHFTGEFPQVEFNSETGFYRLKLKMATKASVKVAIGGNVSSTSLNQAYLGFDFLHITSLASNYFLRGYFGTYYNSAQIGGRHDMYTQFPFYLEYKYGYENFTHDNSNASNYYRNKNFRYLSSNTNYVAMNLGVPVFNNWALRIGLTFGIDSYQYFKGLHTAADKSDNSGFMYGVLSGEVQKKQMNFTLYPTEGFNHKLGVKYVMGLESYEPGSLSGGFTKFSGHNRSWVEVQMKGEQYYNISKWFSFGYTVDLTLSNMPDFNNDMMTQIASPSFNPTMHMSTIFMSEYRSAAYLGVGVMPIIKFLNNGNFYMRMYAYGFVPRELFWDDVWQKPTASRLGKYMKGIFGAELVYQTPIGPASFTVAKYTTGPKNWAVMFNLGYSLFGQRRY